MKIAKIITSFALTLVLLTDTVFADGSSSDETKIVLKADYDKVCDFIESHADDLVKASHNEVIKRDKNKVKIKNLNKQETIIFTIQEEVKRGDYKSKMVESHQGGLTEQSVGIKLSKDKKGRTLAVISASASINNPNIDSFGLKVELNKSTKGIKDFLRKNLDK
jgi:hypothetical protein